MIPEAIGIIDTLPLSRNGKIDRAELKRLPLLGRTQSKTAGIGDERDSYRSDLEARLAVEFSEVLGADSVRRDDDFFELGGDSLLATKLAAQIKKNVDEAAELEWEWAFEKKDDGKPNGQLTRTRALQYRRSRKGRAQRADGACCRIERRKRRWRR